MVRSKEVGAGDNNQATWQIKGNSISDNRWPLMWLDRDTRRKSISTVSGCTRVI